MNYPDGCRFPESYSSYPSAADEVAEAEAMEELELYETAKAEIRAILVSKFGENNAGKVMDYVSDGVDDVFGKDMIRAKRIIEGEL